MRRRRLLVRSERLRSDLAADQRLMLDALSGVDRAINTARKVAKPVALIGAAFVLFKLLRRGRARTAGGGVLVKALFWVSMVQRALPYVSLVRNLWRSRPSRVPQGYSDAGTETEHLV